MCTYSGLQTFCVCSLVFLLSCYLSVSESWTLGIYSSLPSSLASGPPKCDDFTLWTIEVLYVAMQVQLVVTLSHSALSTVAKLFSKASVSPLIPKSGYVRCARYIKTKLSSRTPWPSGRKMVGIFSHNIYPKDVLGMHHYITWLDVSGGGQYKQTECPEKNRSDTTQKLQPPKGITP
jgi:hypothetical protein